MYQEKNQFSWFQSFSLSPPLGLPPNLLLLHYPHPTSLYLLQLGFVFVSDLDLAVSIDTDVTVFSNLALLFGTKISSILWGDKVLSTYTSNFCHIFNWNGIFPCQCFLYLSFVRSDFVFFSDLDTLCGMLFLRGKCNPLLSAINRKAVEIALTQD